MAETHPQESGLGPTHAVETHARRSILIVIPTFALVFPRPFKNFLGLALSAAHREGARYRFDVHVPERQLLHSAMNLSVQMMLEGDYEAMIVCDDDCFPPTDAISKLLRHFEDGKDIVAGLGYMRGFPHTTTAGKYYDEGPTVVTDEAAASAELVGFQWQDDMPVGTGLHRVDFCGFPIALITRRAFQQIKAPWFATQLDGGECTHDVYFGAQAGKAEIPVYVDSDLPCGHLTEAPIVTPETRVFARRVRSLLDKKKSA